MTEMNLDIYVNHIQQFKINFYQKPILPKSKTNSHKIQNGILKIGCFLLTDPLIHQHRTLNTKKNSQIKPTWPSFTEIRTNPKCNKGRNLLRIVPHRESEFNPTLWYSAQIWVRKKKGGKIFFFLNHSEPPKGKKT